MCSPLVAREKRWRHVALPEVQHRVGVLLVLYLVRPDTPLDAD